jgi:hypothetical protein
MKISQKQKEELKSIFFTFLTYFIPLAAITFHSVDFNNLTWEAVVALSLALFRSALKASWSLLVERFGKK